MAGCLVFQVLIKFMFLEPTANYPLAVGAKTSSKECWEVSSYLARVLLFEKQVEVIEMQVVGVEGKVSAKSNHQLAALSP